MENKFIELSINETQAVVGGIKTAASMYQTTAISLSRPTAASFTASVSVPSMTSSSLAALLKR
ncbi:hypothetical protein [Reyranella sp.]|uniref:hypothetical protein n=1 Tax=Reyranella sp. TaxID=1929291 RepID=UPI003BAAB624